MSVHRNEWETSPSNCQLSRASIFKIARTPGQVHGRFADALTSLQRASFCLRRLFSWLDICPSRLLTLFQSAHLHSCFTEICWRPCQSSTRVTCPAVLLFQPQFLLANLKFYFTFLPRYIQKPETSHQNRTSDFDVLLSTERFSRLLN